MKKSEKRMRVAWGIVSVIIIFSMVIMSFAYAL